MCFVMIRHHWEMGQNMPSKYATMRYDGNMHYDVKCALFVSESLSPLVALLKYVTTCVCLK